MDSSQTHSSQTQVRRNETRQNAALESKAPTLVSLGKVKAVRGTVLDIAFDGTLPPLSAAIQCQLDSHRWITAIVQAHIGGNGVRAIALDREREQHEKGELQLIEQHAEADRLAKEAQGLRSNVEKDAETQRSALLAAAHEEASGIQEKARQAEIADKRRREQQSASKRRIDAEASNAAQA